MRATPITEERKQPESGFAPASTPALAPLGFGLRLIQALFILDLAVAFLAAAILFPGYRIYDLTMLASLTTVMTAALGVWLIQRRARATRVFCTVGVGIAFALTIIDQATATNTDLISAIGVMGAHVLGAFQLAEWAFIVLYLNFSKRAREVLVHEPAGNAPDPDFLTADEPLFKRIRTWQFWRNLGFYYMVFSMLGHWAEMVFCLLIGAGVFMGELDWTNDMLWRQWLYPFGAEGTALVLVVLFLHPFTKWLKKKTGGRTWLAVLISVIVIGVAMTSIDFSLGITANADYHLWDYRDMPFNFMGQICLQNSVVYTLAATLIVWVFYPLMDKAMGRLPRWAGDAIFIALLAVYVSLALLHFMYLGPNGWVFGE